MLVHGEHLVHDLQLLPPAPLLLGAAELVEGQLRHELPRRHARHVVGGLQHLAAIDKDEKNKYLVNSKAEV